MNPTTSSRYSMRPVRRQAPTHLFAVGQNVRLKGSLASAALPASIYQITAMLPPTGDALQYRIRNGEERHERVTTQDSLEAIVISGDDPTGNLMERTFGRG